MSKSGHNRVTSVLPDLIHSTLKIPEMHISISAATTGLALGSPFSPLVGVMLGLSEEAGILTWKGKSKDCPRLCKEHMVQMTHLQATRQLSRRTWLTWSCCSSQVTAPMAAHSAINELPTSGIFPDSGQQAIVYPLTDCLGLGRGCESSFRGPGACVLP